MNVPFLMNLTDEERSTIEAALWHRKAVSTLVPIFQRLDEEIRVLRIQLKEEKELADMYRDLRDS